MVDKYSLNNEGGVIDNSNGITFDSFWELLTVLNGQSNRINQLDCEIKNLKNENLELRRVLKDMGVGLHSNDEIVGIREEIADGFLKPLFTSNGFDVDIDTTNGFTIIPKGDDVND